MTKEFIDRHSYKETDGIWTTISLDTKPIGYKDGDVYKDIQLELKDLAEKGFVSEKNCLKSVISDGSSEGNSIELITDTGFGLTINFLEMKYVGEDEEEIISYPYKRNSFLTFTRDDKPVLIQKSLIGGVVDEYQIDRGQIKKSIILDEALPEPTIDAEWLKVTHEVILNQKADVICSADIRTEDFKTILPICFASKEGDHLDIELRSPEMFDAEYKKIPVFYEFKFLSDLTYELSYVVNLKLLSRLSVKYPLTIDPTASVSRTTVGTSSTTFYVGREHQASYTYDLYGWNDDAKSPTYNYSYFRVRNAGGTLKAEVRSGTNSRVTGSGSVNFRRSDFGDCSIEAQVTRSGYDAAGTITYQTTPQLSWSSLDAQSVGSVITAATMNQVYDNVKAVKEAVSGVSWTWHSDFPVTAGSTEIKLEHITNLRGGLDATDNKNTCSYQANYSGDNSNHSYDSVYGDDTRQYDRSNDTNNYDDGYYY